jgi:hypothetical protein
MGVSSTTLDNVTQADSSSGIPKASRRPEAKAATPVWKALAPVAIAAVLALLPVPSGLAPHGYYFFSIFVGVIVGLILEPLAFCVSIVFNVAESCSCPFSRPMH